MCFFSLLFIKEALLCLVHTFCRTASVSSREKVVLRLGRRTYYGIVVLWILLSLLSKSGLCRVVSPEV